jgi:hypothetical protein
VLLSSQSYSQRAQSLQGLWMDYHFIEFFKISGGGFEPGGS